MISEQSEIGPLYNLQRFKMEVYGDYTHVRSP